MRMIAIFAILVLFTGCHPMRLPILKEEARRQAERITRETDEAIKKSSKLQELNRLCTETIPMPAGFQPLYRSTNYEETFISYSYQSKLDYQSVKQFYRDYFGQNGWELKEEEDDGWGLSKIVFHKDSYRVSIYDKESGAETYGIVCKKLQ